MKEEGDKRVYYDRFIFREHWLNIAGRDLLRSSLTEAGIDFKEGALLWKAGPAYETMSEVVMGQLLGASVVTMSSLPEHVIACSLGVRSWPLSWISNYTCNLSQKQICHDDVLAAGKLAVEELKRIVTSISYVLDG